MLKMIFEILGNGDKKEMRKKKRVPPPPLHMKISSSTFPLVPLVPLMLLVPLLLLCSLAG